MDTYVVRIVQREIESRPRKRKKEKLIGIVEVVGTDQCHRFHDADELWEILKSPPKSGA